MNCSVCDKKISHVDRFDIVNGHRLHVTCHETLIENTQLRKTHNLLKSYGNIRISAVKSVLEEVIEMDELSVAKNRFLLDNAEFLKDVIEHALNSNSFMKWWQAEARLNNKLLGEKGNYQKVLQSIKSDIKTDYTDQELQESPLLTVILEQIDGVLEVRDEPNRVCVDDFEN